MVPWHIIISICSADPMLCAEQADGVVAMSNTGYRQ